MASSDPELALEEALRRIQGDHSNESEPEDTSSTVSSTEEVPTDFSRRDTSVAGQSVSSAGVRLLCMPLRSTLRQSAGNSERGVGGGPGASTRWSVRSAAGFYPRSSQRTHSVNNSKDIVLSQADFSQMVYERLESVSRERHQLRLRAQNFARQLGKPIKEIMSLDWSDAPDCSKKFISLSPEETPQMKSQREPSCSDSGLGFSYSGQSYSDLRSMDDQQDALVNHSIASSKHSNHSSVEYNRMMPGMGHSPEPHGCIQVSPSILHHHLPALSFTSPIPSSSSTASSSFYSSTFHHHTRSHQTALHHSLHSSPLPPPYPHSLPPMTPQPSLAVTASKPPLPPPPSIPLLVAYTMDTSKNTFAKRISLAAPMLTLRQFKDDIFARKGSYRYFFKKYCEELNDVILEEATEDMQVLPLYNGSIIGHVEKIATS